MAMDEDEAREELAAFAAEWGYGPACDWLRDSWVKALVEDGVTEGAAKRSVAHSIRQCADEMSPRP